MMAIPTRRPYTGSDIINYQPITSILTKNSLMLTYDGGGLLSSVEINDGHVKKIMTISRNANDQITGISTVISEV